MSDWKSGTLLGSGYAFVGAGRVLFTAESKAQLRDAWQRVMEKGRRIRPRLSRTPG